MDLPLSFLFTDGSLYTEGDSQTESLTVIGDTREELTLIKVKPLTTATANRVNECGKNKDEMAASTPYP